MMAKLSRVTHLAVLQKFIYRLSSDLSQDTRARLEILIRIYQRLYVKP